MNVHLPTQVRGDVHVHPPKVELFDLVAKTNTDPKRQVRAVDEYRLTEHGLYMSRAVVGHPKLRHFESWLLPDHGLRVTRQSWWPGHERDFDFYVDVVRVRPDEQVWQTVDLYLDLLVRTGREVEVLDTDELMAAVRLGMLSASDAQLALEGTYRAVAGIAAHGYDIQRWLAAEGVHLAWSDSR
jgi:predicted RNA-binding protein associated with RNAse of E/G family